MTTREFYEAKAKECGYDDFLHWIDCYDYTLQPQMIVEWTDEIVKISNIPAVVGRSEQLKAFLTWLEKEGYNCDFEWDETTIEAHIKSL